MGGGQSSGLPAYLNAKTTGRGSKYVITKILRVMAPIGVIIPIGVMAPGADKKRERNDLIRFSDPNRGGCDNPDINSTLGARLRATTSGCGPRFQL